MGRRMKRFASRQNYTVKTTEADSAPVGMNDMAVGSLELEAAGTVDIYASNAEDKTATFKKLYDKTGNQVQIVAAVAGVYAIPDAAYNVMYIKFVAASEMATQLCLKS